MVLIIILATLAVAVPFTVFITALLIRVWYIMPLEGALYMVSVERQAEGSDRYVLSVQYGELHKKLMAIEIREYIESLNIDL